MISNNNSYQELLSFLRDSRTINRNIRLSLKNITYMVKNNHNINEDLYAFAITVRGILLGAMSDLNYQRNLFSIESYLNQDRNTSELVFYEGSHTLLDFIREIETLVSELDENKLCLSDNQELYTIVLEIIQKKVNCLEKYNEMMVASYERMRWKIFKVHRF